jgi:hypothetical protein
MTPNSRKSSLSVMAVEQADREQQLARVLRFWANVETRGSHARSVWRAPLMEPIF